MYKFYYEGPVVSFETVVQSKWKSSTWAVTEKKAISNLSYQWKKLNGLIANTRISLPGKLTIVDERS